VTKIITATNPETGARYYLCRKHWDAETRPVQVHHGFHRPERWETCDVCEAPYDEHDEELEA